MIRFDVCPMAKPRMTKSDAWRGRKVVADYWEFKARLKAAAGRADYRLGQAIRVVFVVPVPKSWPARQKRAMIGQPHAQKPDLDNYTKALLDCLAPADDSHVWKLDVEKRWGERGYILIENLPTDVEKL
jgi:Holliday junction resolvase RusA-like endonuclease